MKIKKETIIEPLPSIEFIAKKESSWRVKLPVSYKEFIMKYNGGVPEEQFFIHNSKRYELVRFLGIIKDIRANDLGWYDIGVVTSPMCERFTDNEDLIGMELVPIAEVYYKDYLCLDFRKDSAEPTICIWSNDESGDFSPVTEKVVDTFLEFVDMLTVE